MSSKPFAFQRFKFPRNQAKKEEEVSRLHLNDEWTALGFLTLHTFTHAYTLMALCWPTGTIGGLSVFSKDILIYEQTHSTSSAAPIKEMHVITLSYFQTFVLQT